jgi:murein DD-endopeptidase MepM/ murein hydrolase activator NlpD
MAFKVLTFTQLHLNKPPPAVPPSATLSPNQLLVYEGTDAEKNDEFIKASFTPPGGAKVVGFVKKSDCIEIAEDIPRPEINQTNFVIECFAAERAFNFEPDIISHWVVSAELLIARAVIETGIKNVGVTEGSDGVGPLRVTTAEWDDFLKNCAPKLVDGRTAADRDRPMMQIRGAAWRMHTLSKAISEAMRAKGVGATATVKVDGVEEVAEAPFMPTYQDLAHAYLLDDPQAAVAIIEARADPANLTKKLDQILVGLDAKKLAAQFASRAGFFGAPEARTLDKFLTATSDALSKALAGAAGVIGTLAKPEDRPTPPKPIEIVMKPVDQSDVAQHPAGNPVPFAGINTPLNQTFWPIITGHAQALMITYRTKAGKLVGGNRGRCFFADRSNGKRHHVGVDLFCRNNDVVVACAPGKIVNFYKFYRTKAGEDSFALFVAHDGVVINYGEVKANARTEFKWKIGDTVVAGQPIARVSTTDMIHLEAYVPGVTVNARWLANGSKPASLLDPTLLLLALAENGTRILPGGGHTLPGNGASAQVAVEGKPVDITDDDLMTLARTLFGEARGESSLGREAVAHAIMNRVRTKFRGNTPAEVCLSNKQFSCWNKDDPNRNKIIALLPGSSAVFDECVEIADRVLKSQLSDNTGGARHYHNKSVRPDWSTHPKARRTAVIGNHIFYADVP